MEGKEKFKKEQYLYNLPANIREEIERIQEEKFWTEKYLAQQFEEGLIPPEERT